MANLDITDTHARSRYQRRRTGKPVRVAQLLIDGIASNAAREGEMVRLWQHLAVTSDDPRFHTFVESFDSVLSGSSPEGGAPRLESANQALLIIHADNTADVWVDNLSISMNALVMRSVKKGEAVYIKDIGDIRGIKINGIHFMPDDKVICILREAWRFGFYMNLTKRFDPSEMSHSLATLYRRMRYAHLYDAISDEILFDRLVSAGWFPFAEIIGSEFKNLLDYARADWSLEPANALVINSFDSDRLDRMLSRWLQRPHFSAKKNILEAAINAYKLHEPIAVLKIVLTEIEGILADAHKAETGQRAKLKKLLRFAKEAAFRKSGAPDSLLLPEAFGSYLENYTFASFDPVNDEGTAGSRHAVGHGAAAAETYTQTRALQALLTLDQLALAT